MTEDDIGKQSSAGKDVVLRREDIHFYALSDRYVVELPLYGPNIYSLGDFVLFSGLGLIVLQAAWLVARPGASPRNKQEVVASPPATGLQDQEGG
ncbi:MAG TPA: hypothetical protein PJ994_06080 [Tepidiformaceae bacterium]|nr:hypothetical protein [Tepidiformaceae bacterium]